MTPEEYDAAREYLSENWADEIKMAEHFENALQHIDAQAAQIKQLKEKLVEERARRICHRSNDSVGHWPRYEDMLMDEARQQLKAEMPGVAWDDGMD